MESCAMKWNVGIKIGSGFGLALAILLVIGVVTKLSTVKLTDTAAWVTHTHQVLEGVERLLSGLKDAETGQRGYILTGDEKYLEPYRAARDVIHQSTKTLRELTKDNDNQQRRLDKLEGLVDGNDGKLAELQETIEARQDKAKGFEVALQIVRTDKG